MIEEIQNFKVNECLHTYADTHVYTHTYTSRVCVCVCVCVSVRGVGASGRGDSWLPMILAYLRQWPKGAFAFAVTGDLLPLASFLCYIFLALKLMRCILHSVSKHLKKTSFYILSFVLQSYFRPISVLLNYIVYLICTLLFCSLSQMSF